MKATKAPDWSTVIWCPKCWAYVEWIHTCVKEAK